MFFQRLISSLILIPLVLGGLFYGPITLLLPVLGIILLLCAWEWGQLVPVASGAGRLAYVASVLALAIVAFYGPPLQLGWGLLWWALIILAILTYPHSLHAWGKPVIVALDGWLTLTLFLLALMGLYQMPQGKSLILYLLFLVWAADVGAYLLGKACGKHKLIPQVSPGKSWEGLFGGLALAMLVAAFGQWYFAAVPFNWYVLAMVTAVISVFGDLHISVLKRRCGLKDSGHLIPGHGGILDRLDSLMAAVPMFYCGLLYLPLGR